jgi:hypothetical protein
VAEFQAIDSDEGEELDTPEAAFQEMIEGDDLKRKKKSKKRIDQRNTVIEQNSSASCCATNADGKKGCVIF